MSRPNSLVGSSTPHEITEKFFLSWDALTDVTSKRKKEAVGHEILLKTGDSGLQLAVLLEGTTIDFLFQDSSGSRIQDIRNVKNYIRDLTLKKQYEVIEFYKIVYSSLIRFYHSVERCCLLCDLILIEYSRSTLHSEILEAFSRLYRVLYSIGSAVYLEKE